jgi:hypothetical protein
MIANYCKEISRELDYNVVPTTPLRELELVAEMRWLRTMLREAKMRLSEVEDLELEIFTLKDQASEYKKENERLNLENARLEKIMLVVTDDRDRAEEQLEDTRDLLEEIKEVLRHG